METHLIKPKRHRRTKLEMKAFRDSQIFNSGEIIPKDKKSSHKSNLEVSVPILDITEAKELSSKKMKELVGWVNVYKDGKTYWLGSDIHSTVEDARKVAGKACVKQIQITFEVD